MYHFDITLSILLSATTINITTSDNVIYLDKDYSIEAQEIMLRNKPYEFFNPSDILYRTLIREMEESDYK
jgi:hypothetical protein